MSNITLKMDPIDKILLKRALGKNGKAAHFLASEVKRLSDPYVPKRSGILKGTAVITHTVLFLVEMRHFQPLVCHLFVLKITEIGLKSLQLHCSKTPQNRAFSHFTKDRIRCAD